MQRITGLLDNRMEMLSLSAELFKIFARDESEDANIEAINAIQHSFKADAAALFYINGKSEYRICLAGTAFPIALPAERWKACVDTHTGDSAIAQFGSWSIPGIDRELPAWISARLYASEGEGGYVFLGREGRNWSDMEMSSLSSIRETIAPIVQIRHDRGIEENGRKEAEVQLAKNESRLRDLFEGSRDMIYTAGADDIVTSVNTSACKLLGIPSKNDIVGKPYSEFVLNDSDRDLFLQRLSKDGYVDDYEIVLTKSDRSALFCLETAHAIKDASGNILELQGIVKDITERIKSERDLWKSNLQLAEANQQLQKTQIMMVQREKLASIGQLAAGVAHEINNPLGFLISNEKSLEKYFKRILEAWQEAPAEFRDGFSVLSAKWKLDAVFEDAGKIFVESRDGFERIAKIVGNLKSFSRIDQSADFDAFDVNAGIESTLVVARNEIRYVADIEKNFGDLPLIRAKGGEINQVFLNILVNGAQAIGDLHREEKSHIAITTRVEGPDIIISIRDDGPGMPATIRNRIFDPFFTTKEPGKGTGLGLSISYDIIVNKHGGSISVESTPGVGTEFFITLPIAGPREPEEI